MTRSVTAARGAKGRGKTAGNTVGLWIVGVSAGIVLLVVLFVALGNRPSARAIDVPDLPSNWLDRNAMGSPDAPVTVQAWEDFLCPACRQWNSVIEPQLVEQYVKTGIVRLEFRQFPLTGHQPGSGMAAMASLCAADQGAFWSFHNRLFLAQDQGQAGFTIDAMVRYAEELGLNSRTLLECMTSQKHRDEINASFNEAVTLGLNATPSILVNGVRMENPFDYNELTRLIEWAQNQ
jgi:protein-disulfide isomerase